MEVLLSSKDIVERAIKEYKPYAVVMMVSGGHDSVAAYYVCKMLGIEISHIMHGVTGTGVKETTEFCRQLAPSHITYLEANAGNSYENYVLRKGFYGIGSKAHLYAYHTLKSEHFKKTLSKHIRQRKRGRTILLLNGARHQKSQNRKRFRNSPIRADGSNVWVNVINNWSITERNGFLSDYKTNKVADILCRSGECLCGTLQSQETRTEVSYWFPEWGKWLNELEKKVKEKHGWGWGEDMPCWVRKKKKLAKQGAKQLELPMCHSCIEAKR